MKKLVYGAVVSALTLIGCGPSDPANEIEISEQTFTDPWPFTVDKLILGCENNMVYVKIDGKKYAVNGNAKDKFKPVDPYWKDNPNIPGAKVPIRSVIKLGLEKCK